MEGDVICQGNFSSCASFNPRLPDGGRLVSTPAASAISSFQSTPPGWRATTNAWECDCGWQFQSTPPGWRATQRPEEFVYVLQFQSTPPGWRATCPSPPCAPSPRCCNPRLPDGGRPNVASWQAGRIAVSIHASRMEGDQDARCTMARWMSFNPRLPDGGRPIVSPRPLLISLFQSTPPGWRATSLRFRQHPTGQVSIHASRMEGDKPSDRLQSQRRSFNPRLPDGGRRRPTF